MESTIDLEKVAVHWAIMTTPSIQYNTIQYNTILGIRLMTGIIGEPL